MELNKIAASILLSALIIVLVSNVVDIMYNPEVHHNIEHNTVITSETRAPQQNIQEIALDIEALMKNTNFEKGKTIAKKCIACHSFEKGGPNKVGPNLWNIVGNKKAHLGSAFNYSKAILEKGGIWGYEELFAFLKNPKAYIKGTRMAFAGISKPEEVADLITYLRQMSDNPMPLPQSK